MPAVHEEAGLRWYIYLHDHEPPHVHVRGGSGVVVLFLDQDASVREASKNMKQGDIRKAQKITKTHRAKLLAAWQNIHG